MRTLLFALLVVFLADAASAQRHRPIAEKGDLALTAQITGLSELRIVPALGGIGLRYRLGDRSVLGTSVGFNVQSSDGGGSDRTRGGATVTVWTEQHVGGRRRAVSPFLAFGVQGNYDQTSDTRSQSTTVCAEGRARSRSSLRRPRPGGTAWVSVSGSVLRCGSSGL
ncbi:MAG: hypothetical protein AAGJ11_03845 [Bacteroidota bacterium]